MKYIATLILAVAFLGLATGCTTLTPQQASGKTLVSIAQTVDATMKGWATWVTVKSDTATPVSAQAEDAVKTAYQKYQSAMAVARTAYVSATDANNTTALQAALAALQSSQAELLQLITTFQKP